MNVGILFEWYNIFLNCVFESERHLSRLGLSSHLREAKIENALII